MKSIMRMVIGIPLTVLSLLLAWILYGEYKEMRYKAPIVSAETKLTVASRQCMIAEVSEGAASENDQVMIASALLRVAKKRNVDPCFLFSRYTLLRAPSDEGKTAGLRDPNAIELKTYLPAYASRHALATTVVDRVLSGNVSFATGEDPAIELKRHQMLACVEKYERIWWMNTARTDDARMKSEMGESFKSPLGTVFFCPK